MIGLGLGLEQLVAADLALGDTAGGPWTSRRWAGRRASGPPGTKIAGRWPKLSAAITRPGTILSQMPSNSAPSNMSCDSATAVAIAITSRLNSDSSMPGWPWVTPSHIAGTPPANWATAARLAHRLLDQRGEALERLMGREHVVVGRHDRDVGLAGALERRPCRRAAGGEAVGEVAAGERGALRPATGRLRGCGRDRRRAWRRCAPRCVG